MFTTEALKTELARRDFLEFVVQTSNDDYHVAPCHSEIAKVINQFVLDIEAGLRPVLIISQPPRSGKSHMVSERLPLFLLGKHPDWEVVSCSYSADLATKFTFRALEMVKEEEVNRIFPHLKLNPNKQKQNHWETSEGGSFRGVGVGGSLTGSGAHCFPAGTMVKTDNGDISIEKLHYLYQNKLNAPRILSFNHEKGIFEFKKLIATQVLNANLLYEVETISGSKTISTGNHPFNTSISKGIYTNADRLSVGNELFLLPKGVLEEQGRLHESLKQRIRETFLLFLHLFKDASIIQNIRDLQTLPEELLQERSRLLFKEVHKRITNYSKSSIDRNMRTGDLSEIISEEVFSEYVLFKEMCGQESFYSNVWNWQFAFLFINFTSTGICKEEGEYYAEGLVRLFNMLVLGTISGSSHRYELQKQFREELDNFVQSLSLLSAQVKGESISAIRKNSCGAVEVFDIEVEGNHNFFADGFLVHNCLIADDTVKDWEAAMSPRERDRVWDWWTSVAYTRLYPKSGVILCQTRWSIDDLTGRVLAKQREEGNYNVYVLNFPAIATRDEYPLIRNGNTWVEDLTQEPLRRMGEALHPERYPIDMLLQIKANSERVWQALYQGDPRPDGGRYIQTGNIRYILESDLPKEQSAIRWVRGYDLAVKAGKSHDHSASALLGADKRGNLYLKHVTNVKKTWNENKKFIVGIAKAEKIRMAVETVAAFHLAYVELKNELKGVVHISEVKATTDKLTRALGWIDKIEAGCFYIVVQSEEEYTSGIFNLTKWVTPLLEQLQNFDPDVREQEDDMADSISIAYSDLFKAKTPRVII